MTDHPYPDNEAAATLDREEVRHVLESLASEGGALADGEYADGWQDALAEAHARLIAGE